MTKDKDQARMFLEEAARLKAAKENNFCPRCGKRLATGSTMILTHTCTPPTQ
jgi:ribosomal protein S27AE